MVKFHALDYIAMIIIIIGAINWLTIGIMNFDIVGALFGGAGTMVSKIVFTIVGIAGLYAISMFFRHDEAR